ncbi:YslB family protein [Salipaludibacillus daqingensis]|uniref:YslB family protein n=1 Tax=Salipaludibacillus daqingensis TaxID=3041001 RepID=UPI00247529F0|nr:YslB family protein [Salipaludibacillus daqingensis]
MTDNENSQQDSQVSAYSYDLLRHELLPELLGEDEAMILYWAGKSVARKKIEQLESFNSTDFFMQANWGTLKLEKEKRQERVYELVAVHQNKDRPFSLETGFLAQMIELEKGVVSEASYSIKRKKPLTISIIVRWDKKDSTQNDALK